MRRLGSRPATVLTELMVCSPEGEWGASRSAWPAGSTSETQRAPWAPPGASSLVHLGLGFLSCEMGVIITAGCEKPVVLCRDA